MTDRQRILLDCDPGIDDAFAIFCALRYSDLTTVTTVSGNVQIEHTTRNALYVLELAGAAHIPVHRGADRPLASPPAFAEGVHGVAGLGSEQTPAPKTSQAESSATDAILEFCSAGDAVIIATGPLTNIALALQADPSMAQRVRELHWMGGSATSGNVTAFAEFNSFADPEAVAVTLASGMPLTMYGLDLTHQVRLDESHAGVLSDASTLTGRAAAGYLRFYAAHGVQDGLGQPMHDPCAVLGATHPELFTTNTARIVVEVEAEQKRGQTTVKAADSLPHRHASGADATAVKPLIIDAAISPLGI